MRHHKNRPPPFPSWAIIPCLCCGYLFIFAMTLAFVRATMAKDLERQEQLMNRYLASIQELRVERVLERFDKERVVTIRGFFSTGSNWLRRLFLENCPSLAFFDSFRPRIKFNVPVDADAIYGWKHGLFLESEIDRFSANVNHSMIIISREAFPWALSAFKMKAMMHGDMREYSTLFTGLTSSFRKYALHHPVNETGLLLGVSKFIRDYYLMTANPTAYKIIAPNIFEARKQVYSNWNEVLQNPNISDRIIFIRYEDLLSDTFGNFRRLVEELRLPCAIDSERFNPINVRVKMGALDKQSSTPRSFHQRTDFCLTVRTEELYSELLQSIDREFEKNVLGYEYPDTRQQYCKDVVP